MIYRLFRTFEADKTKNQKHITIQIMAIIKELNGHTPKFGKNCFLADNAAIIGDVEMREE